jgi:hypothetical protein
LIPRSCRAPSLWRLQHQSDASPHSVCCAE